MLGIAIHVEISLANKSTQCSLSQNSYYIFNLWLKGALLYEPCEECLTKVQNGSRPCLKSENLES